MATSSRIHVRISNSNYRQLKRLALEHDAHMGRLVDDALILLFTPADQRPDAVILRRLNLIERQLDTIDANAAFQTDLFVVSSICLNGFVLGQSKTRYGPRKTKPECKTTSMPSPVK